MEVQMILDLVRAAAKAVEGSPAEAQAKADLAELEAVAQKHADAFATEAKDWLVRKFRWLDAPSSSPASG
jgi:hypothetical protein